MLNCKKLLLYQLKLLYREVSLEDAGTVNFMEDDHDQNRICHKY